MAPTGAGKTILAMNVINEALKKGRRATFVCDRKTLIAQTSNVARDLGLGYHGIIQANNPMMDLSRPFQIASCQTLMRRGWPQQDVLVVDEAHTQYKTWVDYVQGPDCTAMVIGLSATPFSKGLGAIFTKLVNAATMHDLTEQGILVPMRVFSGRKPDMTGAETTNSGEWTEKAAEERELVLVGDVLTEWQRLAQGLKTIIFGATIRHCQELARQFNEAGVTAAVFCADTTDEDRARILQDFTSGDVRVLVSVEALAKGFDQKDVGAICDCRPLRKSLSTAIQMWGRGLRSSPETGKIECLLLDFSGNVIRFADDFSEVFYKGLEKLDDGEKLDKEVRKDEERDPKACPKCGFSPMGKRCIQCGFEPAPAALVEVVPGHMQELILCGKKVLANDKLDLWAQAATYARQHAKPGKDPHRRALGIYKDITGEWPPRDLKTETAPWIDPTPNTLGKIRSLAIAFAHRRA
jgi:superfamily II DNA or RNA helicase